MQKRKLIEKLVRSTITEAEMRHLSAIIEKNDFRIVLRRIYDLNEGDPINKSPADKGIIGFLNRLGRRCKNRTFRRLIRKPGMRAGRRLIVAEGDSWFEFPVFLCDIIDWIIKEGKYAVVSDAYGGDWISNILYENEYIGELSQYQPEVFLISGGGNDLVGEERLARLVMKRSSVAVVAPRLSAIRALRKKGYTGEQAERIATGRKFLGPDFYALLDLFRVMYLSVFRRLRKSPKFRDMKIITQGYDFAIPSNNRSPFRFLTRPFLKNGNWLYYPLASKGFYETGEQRSVIAACIHEFNEMLIGAGRNIPNVFHVDCRGAVGDREWADELHPRSRAFRRIARTYVDCIENTNPRRKVFRVRELHPAGRRP